MKNTQKKESKTVNVASSNLYTATHTYISHRTVWNKIPVGNFLPSWNEGTHSTVVQCTKWKHWIAFAPFKLQTVTAPF